MSQRCQLSPRRADWDCVHAPFIRRQGGCSVEGIIFCRLVWCPSLTYFAAECPNNEWCCFFCGSTSSRPFIIYWYSWCLWRKIQWIARNYLLNLLLSLDLVIQDCTKSWGISAIFLPSHVEMCRRCVSSENSHTVALIVQHAGSDRDVLCGPCRARISVWMYKNLQNFSLVSVALQSSILFLSLHTVLIINNCCSIILAIVCIVQILTSAALGNVCAGVYLYFLSFCPSMQC